LWFIRIRPRRRGKTLQFYCFLLTYLLFRILHKEKSITHPVPAVLTVYLVGEVPGLRECLCEFEANGMVQIVGTVAAPRPALAGILERRPHLVLLSLQLADGGGMEVLRGLADAHTRIMVYVFSTIGDDKTRCACTLAGACRFFDLADGLGGFQKAISLLARTIARR
jgi:DNA-binding NarL/FixJ family response regulator